ncbi:MAG: DUF1819 family protein [Firmicutes bacterium]|nr:DUF1819 family protein [Bacillota bacterium]
MLRYSSTIKSRPYLYLELKKALSLKLQGFSSDQIKDKAIKENIFSMNSENRKKEIASTILTRMEVLDEFLMDKIVKGTLETSKQLALYALLKTDLLFFEFMNEVYKEKYILNDLVITDKDFNIFFQRKAEQSERVASWKDYTYYKLKQVYIRVLYEAGFIEKVDKGIEIKPPIIEREVIDYLTKKNDEVYIEAMLGEV